ncbi:MAG TPA: hypothetical protein VL593_00555 [Ramlibacter sp.]|nr:hypothetical protein [Ramlibacter sp.]
MTQLHQRVVDDEPVELDAPPMDGDAVELLVSLPVPVAPIELVPLDEVPGVVSVLALPVVVPLLLMEPPEPVVVDGDVDAVDEVEGGEPGVVVVVEAVLDSRFVHAPSDRAAATASTPAVIWVRVNFIRNSL